MSRENGPSNVPEGWGFTATMDRREFLKLTSSGLLVLCVIDPLLGATGAAGARAEIGRAHV